MMVEWWGEWVRERMSPKRADRVTLDTLRSGRAVDRANKAIQQMENDSVLRRRLRLIERREELDRRQNPLT